MFNFARNSIELTYRINLNTQNDMKKLPLLCLAICTTLFSCNRKEAAPTAPEAPATDTIAVANTAVVDTIPAAPVEPEIDTVAVVSQELKKWLLYKSSKVMLTSSAKKDLYETTWPEAQCPQEDCPYEENCGPLFGPSEGKNLRVNQYGKNKYQYSVVCPCGCNSRYKDFTYMEAYLCEDGKVELKHVVWL